MQDSTRSCASSGLVLLAGSSWPRLSAASELDAEASAVIATGRGSSPVRRPASPRAPSRTPKAGVWITPPARNSRRTSAAALVSRRPQGPESAAAHAAETARDAAARAPPAIAAVCNVRDPGPARPASRATAAVNRASATVEMAWPAALSRVGPAFWVKYCRSWLGDDPGRGYGARAFAPPMPPMKLTPARGPLSAPRSGGGVAALDIAAPSSCVLESRLGQGGVLHRGELPALVVGDPDLGDPEPAGVGFPFVRALGLHDVEPDARMV